MVLRSDLNPYSKNKATPVTASVTASQDTTKIADFDYKLYYQLIQNMKLALNMRLVDIFSLGHHLTYQLISSFCQVRW